METRKRQKKDYCIIGLGRYGTAVLDSLVDNNYSVMAIDANQKRIDEVADTVSAGYCVDAAAEGLLAGLGVDKIDHVIVAVGNNIEVSIMVCTILLELGVANITAKAVTFRHEQVLRKLGIKDIVRPEKEAGARTAKRIMHNFFGEFISVSDEYSIVQVAVNNHDITNTSLQELDLRTRGVNIVAVKKDGKVTNPDGNTILAQGDMLVIMAENDKIEAIERYIEGE